MDTHGHEDTANAAGYPLLEEAFNTRMNTPRLNAFYMGNWLTDMSQVIDVEIGPKAKQQGHAFVDTAMRWLLNTTWFNNGSSFKFIADFVQPEEVLQAIHLEAHGYIETAVDKLLTPESPNPHSRWFEIAQAGLLLKGYFKFVHPEKAGEPLRMDLKAFLAIFEKQFTQYYPHEHLDRPEKKDPVAAPPDANSQYDDRLASGPYTGTVSQAPDLYEYLREDIKVIAGLLTDLDLTWARNYLTKTAPFTDGDTDWNLGLAKLGHALHAMEDFFAHSNFIEHAATVMGGDFLPVEYQPYHSRFYKRLARYNYLGDPSDWRTAPFEEYIVTGYFDFLDTANSLGHIAADKLLGIFDLESRDVTEDLRFMIGLGTNPDDAVEKLERKANRYYHDLMEFFEHPSMLADASDDNAVANAVKAFLTEIDHTVGESVVEKLIKFVNSMEKGTVSQQTMSTLVKHMPLFKEVIDLQEPLGPLEKADVVKILTAFYDFTIALRRTLALGSFTWSYYKFLTSLCKLMDTPLLWFGEKIAEKTKDTVIEYAVSGGIYFAKELLLYSWGSSRLGCHSLLSKDHKVHEEIHYEQMSGCAKLVHHAIVKTMMRWSEPNYTDRGDDKKWVNWLALLEFYLCHPRFGVPCTTDAEVLTDLIHVPTAEEQQLNFEDLLDRLIERYQPIPLPPGIQPLDRQKILEANIGILRRRQRISEFPLSSVYSAVLTPVSLPLDIVGIVIPLLRHNVKTCDPTPASKWYMNVMTEGWKSVRPQHPTALVYHQSEIEATSASNESRSLRIRLEREYRQG